jgi:hypothetical protein
LVGDDELGFTHFVAELDAEGCVGVVDDVGLGGSSGGEFLYGVRL